MEKIHPKEKDHKKEKDPKSYVSQKMVSTCEIVKGLCMCVHERIKY